MGIRVVGALPQHGQALFHVEHRRGGRTGALCARGIAGLTRDAPPENMCRMTERPSRARTSHRAARVRQPGFSLPGVDAIPNLAELSGDPDSPDPYEIAQVMTPPSFTRRRAGRRGPSAGRRHRHRADTTPSSPSPFERPLPRFIAIANQKGGVGKTTTAVNLGACLAELGYRVLVVDLDPQGNASTGLGINIRDLQASMYDVILNDLPVEDCVEATAVRNLFVAPAALDLAGAEIELVPPSAGRCGCVVPWTRSGTTTTSC